MYFTRQTEIAISIITKCTQRSGDAISTRQMADQIGIRQDYAAKTVSMLVRNGLLRSVRGRTGGISLAVDPHGLTLGTVLRITQPSLTRPRNPKRKAGASVTAFDIVLDAASSKLIQIADQYTIADLNEAERYRN